MKSSIANGITLSRIMGALCMLTYEVTTQIASPFWLLFAFCGMTDVADGYVARRLKAETKKGALLDSIADIVFVFCSAYKLFPHLRLPSWLWAIASIIAAIKFTSQACAWIKHEKFIFLHTFTNKLTGFLLFVSTPIFVCSEMNYPLILTAIVATYAAIEEGHYIRTK